jgi:filamentous hemagglutinin family protein
MLMATTYLVACDALFSAALAGGGPTGPTVVVGHATVTSPGANQTVIDQTTSKALIDWTSFSIPSGSIVTFEQPGRASLTVNRVTGPDSSVIDGELLATGSIWLINANGILFGKGSEVDVGALLATTSDISDDDFRAGHYDFSKPSANSNASVVNQGTIRTASGGSIILSAPEVSNQGLIEANLGTITLGGASAFSVDLVGDNLIRYEITTPVLTAPTDANGTPAAALVSNSGTLSAAGGKVMMTASAAKGVQDDVINNTGIIQATSVSSHDGEVDFDAGPNGTVDIGGTVDVSGKGTGQTGGTITATGAAVNIADGAVLDASGDRGGGTVLIGGGFHGKGPIANATTTTVGNATIDVDALTKGNGGKVAIWSNQNTIFSGDISARGGVQGGNGGYIETSGHNSLQVGLNATVDTSAAHGTKGSWLLDPLNIIVESGGTTQLTNGTLGLNTDPGQTDTIDPTTITNALRTTDVLLEAANDITVLNDILYSSANSLTMLAEHDINVYANIQNSMATGGGGIYLIAGWDGVTVNPAQLTDPGVYGNNGGSIFVGTTSATGNVAVGAASGTTTIAGANVTVESDNGTAQVGYAGTGGGNIDVFATDDVTVDALAANYALIGNGGPNVVGAITGNIDITAGGTATVEAPYSDFVNFTEGLAAIGNVGGTNSSESGNISITAPGGTSVLAPGYYDLAYIGNLAFASTTGGATGNININTGALTVAADQNQQGLSEAIIGDGGQFTNSGTTGGTIDINASSVLVQADESNYSTGQARIANRGDGAVTGDIDITTTGDLTMEASDEDMTSSALATIGNAQNGTGAVTGAITIQSGGAISLYGTNLGQSRIGAFGDPGNIDITAAGNILLSYINDYAPGAGQDSVFIGNFGNGTAPVGGNIDVTSTGGAIELDASDPNGGGAFSWIGNTSGSTTTGGNVTVTASDATNGNITLNSADSTADVYIGNNDLGGTSVVSGDITVTAGNTLQSTDSSQVMIGNQGSAGGSAENVDISATIIDSTVGGWFYNDIPNGNFTIAQTGTEPTSPQLDGGWFYNSPYALTVSTGGDLTLNESVQNSGTGAISITSRGNILIGGANANSNVSIGSAGGLTTINADNVTVESDNGIAQIGYAGAGGGDIDVNATGNVTVDALNDLYAQIGNGGTGVASSLIGGNITVDAGSSVTVEAPFSDLVNDNDTVALIGNLGGTGSSESGDISVTAPGGVDLSATGIISSAFIGNASYYGVNGAATGNITISTGPLTIYADNNQQGLSEAWIGDGYRFSSSGTTGGTIDIAAGSIDIEADASNESEAQARIANRSAGDVVGDIDITTTGNITLDGNNQDGTALYAPALIGDVSACDSPPCSGTVTGNITIQSGGAISLLAQGDNAAARISEGGATNSDISVTAAGDITLDVTGSGESGDAIIGSFDANAGGGGNIAVTSTGGAITLETSQSDSFVQIGNAANGATGSTSGDVSVTASSAANGNILLENSGEGATVQIGNQGSPGAVSGDVTVTAGNTLQGLDNGQTMIGNLGTPGSISGNVDISAQNVVTSDVDDWILNDIPNGNFAIAVSGANPVTVNGTLDYSSPYTLTLSNGGDITFDNSWQNAGTGAIDIASGGNVLIGGPNAPGNVAVGSAGGLTTVSGDNITVESGFNGSAQIGYAGAGGGNIDVIATGDVTVDPTEGNGYAQIGNGAFSDTGNGGNISVTAGGNVWVYGDQNSGQIGNGGAHDQGAISGNITIDTGGSVNVLLDSGINFPDEFTGIGNMGFTNSSESGNIAITAPGGTYLFSSTGYAFIGNLATAGTSGGATGNITISTGDLSVYDSCIANAYCQTIVGDGGNFNNSGTTGGIIDVTASSVELVANEINGGYGESRIGNRGAGTVVGDIDIASTGDITISAADLDLASIGNGEGGTGTTSGNINVQSGGDISILATGEGEARIGAGSAADTNIDVTAAGNLLISDTNNDAASEGDGPGAWIGNFSNGSDPSGGNITVTSTGDSIELQAGDPNGDPVGAYAWIGNTSGGTTTSGNITVSASNAANGNVILDSADSSSTVYIGNNDVGGTGAVSGDIIVTAGNTLEGSDNGPVMIGNQGSAGISGSVDIAAETITQLDVAPWIFNDIPNGNFTISQQNTNPVVLDEAIVYSSPYTLTASTGGDFTIESSVQNSGTGAIDITVGGNVLVGGPNATGDVAVGSAGGLTTINADNITLDADNGFAQIGYYGAGSGSINVNATGNVTLTGGAGALDFAQIGNGGARTSENSNGYTNTGLITVSGDNVVLDAGAGEAGYAQIGNGGYQVGAGLLSGTATDSGDITVTALNSVTLSGNGADAYAQIGNGGDQVNTNAASGASGSIAGNIDVIADHGLVTMTAGSGNNSYVQIGNGGYSSNAPSGANPANFAFSGNIAVSDLSLTGSDTGTDGYAQVGNGDAGLAGIGDVSGNIDIRSGVVTLTNGTASSADAMIGGATGNGTVTGQITGYAPNQGEDNPQEVGAEEESQSQNQSQTQNTPQEPSPPNGDNTGGDDQPTQGQGAPDNAPVVLPPPPPYEVLADAGTGGDTDSEGDQETDGLVTTLGQSLEPTYGTNKNPSSRKQALIPGLLKQIVTNDLETPHGIPPADEDYSNWGNEAIWR